MKTNSKLLMGFLMVVLVGVFGQSTPGFAGADTGPTIYVDCLAAKGTLPPLYGPGFFTTSPHLDVVKQKVLEEQTRPGTIELYIWHKTITPSKDLQDLVHKLTDWNELALAFNNRGWRIVIEICGMPLWLSSNTSLEDFNNEHQHPRGFHYPPKDYQQWAEVVGAIVNHFNHRLGLDAYYKIWGEPDWDWWSGTEAEYFKLYRYAALGAKRADPRARVGGPSVSGWNSIKSNHLQLSLKSRPMLYNFIQYCRITPLPELGLAKLPIDFLIWHAFNLDPLSDFSYRDPAETSRRWLQEAGYDPHTEILIGEWNTWEKKDNITGHSFSSQGHDTHFAAAYLAASLIAMAKADITYHCFAYLEDWLTGPEFAGDFGLFTKKGIIKPSYNAMRLFNLLGNQALAVHIQEDPFIMAVASKDQERITLLLTQFIPTETMLLRSIGRALRTQSVDFKKVRFLKGALTDWIGGRLTLETFLQKIPRHSLTESDREKIKTVLSGYQPMIDQRIDRMSSPVPIRLQISNLPGVQNLVYKRYLIDATHSNSYAERDAIAKVLDQTKTEAVNRISAYLSQKGFSSHEIQTLKQALMTKTNIKNRIQALPQAKRRAVGKVKTMMKEQMFTAVREINKRPSIGLQQVEAKKITAKIRSADYLITLSPYSVHCIVIHPES